MRVALTGVSGFIGSVIARHLKEAGYTVTGLVRPTSRRDHIEAWVDRFVVGAQDDREAWPALLEDADCLIHNAFDWSLLKPLQLHAHYQSNLVAALELIHAAGDRQVVYMSSIAVHHDMRDRWGGRIDEDHPLRPGGLYGAAKAAIEAHLWARLFSHGHPFCAIRPCAVYGMDPRIERTIGYPMISSLDKQRRFDKPGGGKFVHVDDVAAITVATIGNERANGQVYNLVDCYARWSDIAQMIADELGVTATIDTSSPPQPKNEFTKDALAALGVVPARGHDGLRAHVREMIAARARR